MSDTLAPVVPIRPGLAARYGDTQAMNDIHALITSATPLTADEATACVAEVTGDRHGTPVAQVDADGTVVLVGQDPHGPGVLVQVTTRDPAEAAGLVITVDGRVVSRSPVRSTGIGRARKTPRRPVTGRNGRSSGLPDGEGGLS